MREDALCSQTETWRLFSRSADREVIGQSHHHHAHSNTTHERHVQTCAARWRVTCCSELTCVYSFCSIALEIRQTYDDQSSNNTLRRDDCKEIWLATATNLTL